MRPEMREIEKLLDEPEEPVAEIQGYQGKAELQGRFMILRARGLSYAKIAEELHVSKNTLRSWEKALAGQIAELKAIELDELFTTFLLTKEDRIRTLGETLGRINKELSARPLEEIATEKLMELSLKYTRELKEEVGDIRPTGEPDRKLTGEEIMAEIVSLLLRVRAGDITRDQAIKENAVLANLLKAYENMVLEKKVDALDEVIKGRR